MNNEIINLVKELNGSIISNITDNESIILNDEFMFLRGLNKKYYYISDCTLEFIEDGQATSNNILTKIENDIIYNESIKQIPSNLIYSIILLKIDNINEDLYKTIIKIEEDEYFSKKYVFYYTEDELDLFNLWRKRAGGNSFNILLNKINNAKLLEDKKNSIGLRFMLRLLVKLPFVKTNIESSHIDDFDEELNNIIKKIRNNEERKAIEKINSRIFQFIDERENINKAIEDYFEICRGV
ncbi:hypothetical protein NE167_11855 [Clostridium botulinum]|uniref:ABC-three component system middle component 1 n=1 Tax=Clostridium botulinum TaxID=1491 RepID=UPI00214993AE|nr:ABC-three component system middle component 1 [Clostridium botulinum]MCR1177775.1 hypothetical protein [Clostridium botulinum]